MAVAAAVSTASCNQQPARAVVVVVHGSTDVVRVAQARIVGTSREGEPVIRVQQGIRLGQTLDADFDLALWAIEQPDVVAVVGHESSASSLAGAPLYREAGLPFLVPNATTPLLDDLEGAFPLAPNDWAQGAFLARFVQEELGADSVTVFFVNDEYGRGLREGIVRELDILGVQVLEELPVLPGSNLDVMVEASLARHVPDAIVAAVRSPDVWTISRRAQELTSGMPVVAGDGAYVASMAPVEAGPGADSVYVSVFWHVLTADSSARRFIADFRRESGRYPRPDDAMVFDAIMLAATAIRQAGADPAAVELYLTKLGVTRPPYRGVTGDIHFHDGRDGPLIMMNPQDGDFVPLSYGN